MTSSSVVGLRSSPQKSTPGSSPPPTEMHNGREEDGVSSAMQKEEERMRALREKNDAKRDAQLEKERQEDMKSGREVLDKKFQQLEFLMNKSKVSTPMLAKQRVPFEEAIAIKR
jgi:ATP-dependent DNA helicase